MHQDVSNVRRRLQHLDRGEVPLLSQRGGGQPKQPDGTPTDEWFAEVQRNHRRIIRLSFDRPLGQLRCLDLRHVDRIGQPKLKRVRGAGVYVQVEVDLPAKSSRFNMTLRTTANKDQRRPVATRKAIRHNQRHQTRVIHGNAKHLLRAVGVGR